MFNVSCQRAQKPRCRRSDDRRADDLPHPRNRPLSARLYWWQ